MSGNLTSTPLERLGNAQRGGAIVALGAGISFWFFLGLLEGVLMFLGVLAILQPFFLHEYWKETRRHPHGGGPSHE